MCCCLTHVPLHYYTLGTGGPFEDLVTKVDILCNCIYLTDAIKTPFVTKAMFERTDRRLTVISDVSCDPDGANNPVPVYTHSTSFDVPVHRVYAGDTKRNLKPVDVSSIDHLPSMVPYEASQEFAAKVLPILLKFPDTVNEINLRVCASHYTANMVRGYFSSIRSKFALAFVAPGPHGRYSTCVSMHFTWATSWLRVC